MEALTALQKKNVLHSAEIKKKWKKFSEVLLNWVVCLPHYLLLILVTSTLPWQKPFVWESLLSEWPIPIAIPIKLIFLFQQMMTQQNQLPSLLIILLLPLQKDLRKDKLQKKRTWKMLLRTKMKRRQRVC